MKRHLVITLGGLVKLSIATPFAHIGGPEFWQWWSDWKLRHGIRTPYRLDSMPKWALKACGRDKQSFPVPVLAEPPLTVPARATMVGAEARESTLRCNLTRDADHNSRGGETLSDVTRAVTHQRNVMALLAVELGSMAALCS